MVRLSTLKIERSYDYGPGGDGYVRVPNFIARGGASKRDLSGIQIGVLVYLLSHTEGYDVTAESIARDLDNGRDAVRTALRDLQKAGYVEHAKARGADGHWQHFLTVRDVPVSAGRAGERESSPWSPGPGESGPIQKTNLKKTKEKTGGGSSSLAPLAPKSDIGASEPSQSQIDALGNLLEDIGEGDIDPCWFWDFLVTEFDAKKPLAWARACATRGELGGLIRSRVPVDAPIEILQPLVDRQNRSAS